ncbi:hypothetical protein H257_13712 [Aphanomyces astaci]|uniref:Uncharacterized protein n=1 Tax=Aphanomyces astaci TaxID=112090 RepID=W4FVY2_APHAT|nr:hypothetical protein H257_13712 [Aphanomyces astaci]ETV70979.1 hypothetical protein H257_13712 [Aphanomyces astaci]RQM26601.1 hypothetical protein B5M09_002384 [Aphanomyces astaci]|eukprot:XP_009839642.1 hypothetical protein H257_13712 [Aphanomyces astaci]
MPLSDMQCKYAYKECYNDRTQKRDGGLHRLCEAHRNKANALQKTYATKRRRELRAQKRHVVSSKLGTIQPIPIAYPGGLAITASVDKDDKLRTQRRTFVYADWDYLFFGDNCDMELIDSQSDVEAFSDDEVAYLNGVL